ncbi:siderophore biosynthesis protein SbnG [Clostridia bacterium]|nr:siderophore biosynthesis protein SbnG [Clostridia bacterium]
MIKPSRTLAKLRSGGVATCTKINLADPRAVEIAAQAGFDCIWLDMEHVPNGIGVIEQQALAARADDSDSLVRVARGAYSSYVRPLESGATGIMVPHVMSAQDARDIVRMTRFHPIGRRPLDGGNTDGAFSAMDLSDYLRQANEERMLIVQIEDYEPLSELDEIASVAGIDMLFFGPGDFSHSLGIPGEFDDPRVIDAKRRVADAAIKHGKFAGTVGSLANAQELIDMGYRFISIGADVVSLVEYFKNIAAGWQRILN